MYRRINQIIELEEQMNKAYDKVQKHQEKMKNAFDRRVKEEQFQIDGLVLKWVGPYVIAGHRGENAFLLEDTNGVSLESNPVNGIFLNHYLS